MSAITLGWIYGEMFDIVEFAEIPIGNESYRSIMMENNIVIDSNSEMIADYGNANWPDQLTEFDGKSITYDNVGNPLEYLEKYSFTWSKGRQLSKITDKKTQQEISLKYNESGLRIYKDTDKLNTEYTWDEGKLLREQVVYKATGKKYDIWYFFDNMGEVVGFEYSYIGEK